MKLKIKNKYTNSSYRPKLIKEKKLKTNKKLKRLVAIVGPTGIGKTRLAIYLASIFHGEIVSADSRQVYQFMDVGTAKPTRQEMALVPHHLINIVKPDEEFSLALFQQKAYTTIDDICNRGRLPFLVGGTGLYVKAVLEGWVIPGVSPDKEFRYNIEKEDDENSINELYQDLVRVDPRAASKIDRRNVRRVIRALEVHAKTRRPFSELGRKQPPPFDSFIIGLTADRPYLYSMVDRRVNEMMEHGFIQEVEELIKKGYSLDLPAMSGIGYRQIGQIIKGELTREEAVKKIKTGTHRFIRHQYAWFHLNDEKIHWFDIERQGNGEIEKALAEYLE
jgi:tRNA dimethylallyltransferase